MVLHTYNDLSLTRFQDIFPAMKSFCSVCSIGNLLLVSDLTLDLLQGQMWFFIPIMAYISLAISRRGFGCEDNL